ncbi:VOC family protein [Micromonospora sp. I033]
MAHETTIPLLPCRSLDDVTPFYQALGFQVSYRQTRPNPYLALHREDLHLHFFGMAEFDPATSYGSCLVVVDDLVGIHREFAAGMRAAYGRVLVSGMPRMTRPRVRKNYDGHTGFSIVDPGGNWIRFVARAAPSTAGDHATGRLARALENAVVQADSRGDHRQAARILDSALSRADAAGDPVVHVEALVYRAELAVVLDEPAVARELLARAGSVPLGEEGREGSAATLRHAADLAAAVDQPHTGRHLGFQSSGAGDAAGAGARRRHDDRGGGMSVERAKDDLEDLAGPARARLGDMNRDERSEADEVRRQDEIRGKRPGEHVQQDARDARDDFTA